MTQKIIFPNELGGISLIDPSLNCGIPLEEIARKDVPANTPYKIIDSSLIPEDHTFFNAWEADFTNPDGYGIGSEAWFAEQNSKESL